MSDKLCTELELDEMEGSRIKSDGVVFPVPPVKKESASLFSKAEKKSVKLKIAITGPSGSGKTYSSLVLASSLGNKIAVVDTENESASLYSDLFNFDTCVLKPPYTTARYLEAMVDAYKAGYDVLIIDSLSHAWQGEGAILDRKSILDARGGNSYTNWAQFTKEQDYFISKINNIPMHVICTMRSKQDYVMTVNDKGKQAPQKVGLAPIQRDGVEYEFTLCLDLDINNQAKASKDRTNIFKDSIFKVTQETGDLLNDWLKK